MRILQGILLCILLFGVSVLYAQQSQETTDALQNQQIKQVSMVSDANTVTITALAAEMSSLRSSVDRLTGIGIGLGAALTSLQGILVIVTVRNGKKQP